MPEISIKRFHCRILRCFIFYLIAAQPPSNSTTTTESLESATSGDTNTGISTLSSSSYEQSSSIVHTVGNRLSLGEDTWSGWSSTFESEPGEAPETPKNDNTDTFTSLTDGLSSTDAMPDQPSFNSLLQTYGAPTPLMGQTPLLYEKKMDFSISSPIDVKVTQLSILHACTVAFLKQPLHRVRENQNSKSSHFSVR